MKVVVLALLWLQCISLAHGNSIPIGCRTLTCWASSPSINLQQKCKFSENHMLANTRHAEVQFEDSPCQKGFLSMLSYRRRGQRPRRPTGMDQFAGKFLASLSPKRLGPQLGAMVEGKWTRIILWSTVGAYALQCAYPKLMFQGAHITYLVDRGQWWRLFTPMLLHGSFWHLGLNMMSLNNIGPAVERHFGSARFLGTYVACGVAGNVLTGMTRSRALGVGASGAVFGLLGALGAFTLQNKRALGPSADQVVESLKRTALINLLWGAMNPGINNMAHMGGLAAGYVLGVLIGPRFYREYAGNGRFKYVDRPLIPLPFTGKPKVIRR